MKYVLSLFCIWACLPVFGADIKVLPEIVVHNRPRTLNGTNIKSHTSSFATGANGVPFKEYLKKAGVGLVRSVSFPGEPGKENSVTHGLDYYDRNVKSIIESGAVPLLVHYIKPGLPYLKEDGGTGGTVESNLVFLTRRYTSPPYSLDKIYWEIGNEPDYTIDYKVSSADEYTGILNKCHEALLKNGLREKSVICGPVVISPYRFAGRKWFNTELIDAVMDECKGSVDIITYHSYSRTAKEIKSPYQLLNNPEFDRLEDHTIKASLPLTEDDYGMSALLAKMEKVEFGRPSVGIGITEFNTNIYSHEIYSGLYCLGLSQLHYRNPRSLVTMSFVFDDLGDSYGGNGHFDSSGNPDYNYWALWIAGNLRGENVLRTELDVPENRHGYPALLVLASVTGRDVYLEVINRTDKPLRQKVAVFRADLPKVHRMSKSVFPERNIKPLQGIKEGTFSYVFPEFSATVFHWSANKAAD